MYKLMPPKGWSLHPITCVMEEREDQIGTMAQPGKTPIGLLPNLPGVLQGRIQEMALHVAVTSLLGIQVRGVGRQLLHHDL
ncbi:MAG TPA: hypothetical protein VKP69_23335, partial [Isosphaeraceae bacterium]|nr:hypothetical protein [Isosphaeraceae bacterium]